MHVLHINQSDINGGAAIAGYRLHQGLIRQGINSSLLTANALTDDPQVAIIPRRHRIEYLLHQITFRLGLHTLHSIGSFEISKEPFFETADVLNFHNLHSTNFSYLAIPKLTQEKPAVYTLHDMWSFTGHCASTLGCDKWKAGCGRCPYPDSYPAIVHDNTSLEWKLKNWVYSCSNLTIVTPSRWLTEQAKVSMLNRFCIHHIPHGIDTNAYRPLDPELCRAVFNIPVEKKVIAFGTTSLRNILKGGDLLLKALQSLPTKLKQQCVLLTFGQRNTPLESVLDLPAIHLGYIDSDFLKSMVYSVADLFLHPTRADVFGLVLQESMACGTPMVSFEIGGVPDLVRPGVTGYLAKPEDVEDFKNGIIQLLEDDLLRRTMKLNCRQIALAEYSLNLQATRYINLYQKILNNKPLKTK
jgi:glycosyltransferase involved in cell wall biosynthesis